MEYAIDFGTSNTAIARTDGTGEIETIRLSGLSLLQGDNPPLIPSIVYVEDACQGRVLVGQEVRDRGLDLKTSPSGEKRYFHSFKRGIGAGLPGFAPELDGQTVTLDRVGAWFLNRLLDALPDAEALVFTVPVESFEAYRYWLATLCAPRDRIKQVRLLDEPTAAALGYGLRGDGETVLVIDFGGGTLDLALVKLQAAPRGDRAHPLGLLLKWGDRAVNTQRRAPTARTLAKAGQHLGGMDIDHWLADYFQRQCGLPSANPIVARLAERIKIALSSSDTATEVYFDERTFESYELSLDRPTFEAILTQQGFFQRLEATLDRVAQQAQSQGVDLQQVDAVLLVGGTAQIPAVRNWVRQRFAPEIVRSDRPFEAIARGAVSQRWEVTDILYHSYGIRYWDKRYKRHGWHPIVRSGQALPLTAPVELVLGASVADQPSIELIVGELAETDIEVYFEGDRLVTRSLNSRTLEVRPLNDTNAGRTIARLDPPGQPGIDRVKVTFTIDARRMLCITVEDLLAGETLLANCPVVQLA